MAKKKAAKHVDPESNILQVVDIERKQKQERSIGEKISEGIASFAGSMAFVYLHIAWFGGWIAANTILPFAEFDPFPFTFLTLIVSLEAIFLSTFILISQNHETELTDRRNNLDLQINMMAEQENTKMLELLQAIAEKVGVDCDDEAIRELTKPIDPEVMMKKITEARGRPS